MSLVRRIAIRPIVIALALACVWLSTLTLGFAAETDLSVKVTSIPPLQRIRPDTDYARVTLQVLQHGQSLSAGHLEVNITSPGRTSWISTDFPMVEGTPLLSLASDLQDGMLTFDYLFPIRGVYQVDATVSPVPGGPDFPTTTLQQTLQLRENPAEVRNVWILIGGLLLLGGIGGALFARSASAREALPSIALLVVLIGLGMITPGSMADPDGQYVVQGEGGWVLDVRTTPTHATVGQLLQFDVMLSKDGAVFPEATQTTLLLHHVEDDKAVFETTTRAQTGASSQRFQFFDGAPHTVTIRAQPVDQDEVTPLQAVFEMEVEGLQPPMAVKIRTLFILIGVLAVGMAAGFFLLGSSKERGVASV
ncbi:MAG: hypothetical protein OEU26_29445 [Candidatus Tectomicrobia bacterium]|nr:hypothetical protein [Candidatus Tectomicrobia bacterium]